MIAAKLEACCRALAIPFDPAWIAPVSTHLRLLERWSKRMNLTSVSNPEDAVIRHVADSLSLLKLDAVRHARGKAADIGSGAGFPGIPLAIACPDVHWTLIEPRRKRGVFLQQTIAECGLPNAAWLEARAPESAPHAAYDLVVSRATLAPDALLEAARPLLRAGGVAVVMAAKKSSNISELSVLQHETFEIDGASRWIAAVGGV